MDSAEIDKILKEKLRDKITPSEEFQSKMKEKIKEEKANAQKNQKDKKASKKSKETASKENKPRKNGYKKIISILSVAAVFLIVFVAGMNLNGNLLTQETSVATITAVEPTKLESGILQNNSEFIITAEGENIDESSVAKSLYIEPALEYTISKTANENEYKLTFKQNIPDNTILKLQYVKDKITEDSWAYQTSNKLSVNKTYPSNYSIEVAEKTVIEIEFSYASTENIGQYVEISPKTEGNWEHFGNVWRFTPTGSLKEGTKYTVKVKKGIKAEDQTMENDYKFSFTVGSDTLENYYAQSKTTIDGISTFKSDESVKIYYQYYDYDNGSERISKIKLTKLSNTDDFINYLKSGDYDSSNSEEVKFSMSSQYIQLSKTLTNGYYVASIQNSKGKEYFNCPIQINDISAYAVETERDVIAWVAEKDALAKNIKVSFNGKEQTTNSDGFVKFENIIDGSEKTEYLTIGNNDNKLVVGMYNYSFANYPNAYLYTDRPLYKNTDTIKVWGFVPLELFYEKVEDNFYIELNEEGKQKVKVSDDGIVNYEFELKNHVDTGVGITLYYKDTSIAYRYVEIENYEAQNYSYETIVNKNYGYENENFEFDVKVTHITGISVPNKSVVAEFNHKIYTAKTGEDGIAHFKIKLSEKEDTSSEPYADIIYIYNGDSEEYNMENGYISVYIINRDTHAVSETEDKTCKVKLYKLDTNKNVNVDYDLEEIYNGVYDTEVQISLEESVTERYISNYIYDEYTKQEIPEYSYETTENIQKIKTVNTKNGEFEINYNELKMKTSSEEKSYSYRLIFTYKDTKGREVEDSHYIYIEEDLLGQNQIGYYYEDAEEGYSYDSLYEAEPNIDLQAYYTYRYFLKKDLSKFSIGDTVNFTLAESKENGIAEIENKGKLLEIVLQEDVSKTEIIDTNKFSYKFTDDDFPGCKITTAYFINGKFYRMPVYYFDFKEEDRKVDVEITADKEKYEPGDTVTLKVKTTNNSKPIKTIVNISVANEAVFSLEGDYTDIVDSIYENRTYPVYTYSTNLDQLNSFMGGAGGGGGEPRGDFGDTAYFGTVNTNSNGEATVTFKLPDNVTTYRVTAHSANKDLYVGVNTIDITSTLDFFVQSTEPRGIKTTDDLVLNATSVADEKYDVDFEFTIKELNKTLTAKAQTNSIATVNFGKLPYGTYHAVIKGKYGDKEDAIEYEFNVVESVQEVKAKTTTSIDENTEIKPSKTPVVLEIYNKNIDRNLKYIDFVESTKTARLDTKIAYNQIQEIKEKYYGTESTITRINIDEYRGDNYYKNLVNGEEDIVLTALIRYYAQEYYDSYVIGDYGEQLQDENLFEIYLLAAANNEPVLLDLLYLKDEEDLSNYNKLLVTLSLEFLGDFKNAKELYNGIELSQEEKEQYASIIAIIDTFINKQAATTEIDALIEKAPADEYLRFAILSFFENNSSEIAKEETVTIVNSGEKKTITVNGMEVETYTIYNEDLSSIKFETDSKDLMVSYYYQTLLEDVDSDDISKDIKIKIDGDFKKGNTVNLVVEFSKNYSGEVKIALPNSLRLAQDYNYSEEYEDSKGYYLEKNRIDYVTFFKEKDCKKMTIPLIVTLDGNYKFENVVCIEDGNYHISNSIDLK